jgi:purine-cytosine permease-like protein
VAISGALTQSDYFRFFYARTRKSVLLAAMPGGIIGASSLPL